MQCTGEEAIGVAPGHGLGPARHDIPDLPPAGLLIARGCPLVDMMCQIYLQRARSAEGPADAGALFVPAKTGSSRSGNLATQFVQAVGWAMASANKQRHSIAAAWIGEGSTAEGDFHAALTSPPSIDAPVILNIVNNQWAISSFQGIAGGDERDLRRRGARLRHPGAARRRQRLPGGACGDRMGGANGRAPIWAPTLIEYVHLPRRRPFHLRRSPRYRPADEADAWPLGDPISG